MAKITCNLDELKWASGKIKASQMTTRFITVSALVRVAFENGKLSLTATDIDNMVKVEVNATGDEGGEGYIALDKFCGLIDKFDKETVDIEFNEADVTLTCSAMKGKGYSIAKSNEVFEYSDVPAVEEWTAVDWEKLQQFLKISPVAVAQDNRIPKLANYYLGNDIISACQTRVCRIEANLFNAELVIPPPVHRLWKLFDKGDIKFGLTERGILLADGKLSVLGLDGGDMGDSVVSQVRDFVKIDDDNSQILIKKNEVLKILERLALFTTLRDSHACKISFANDNLILSSSDGSASEGVEYAVVSDKVDTDFSCYFQVAALVDFFRVVSDEELILSFGGDTLIHIVANGMVYCISRVFPDER